jgi:PAS domain S-box-containing protein
MKNIVNTEVEAEQQYLTFLNSLNDPMHVINRDLRIVFQNPAMIKWLKKLHVNSEIVGKTVFEAFPFLEFDLIYNEYESVFNDKEIFTTTDATNLFGRVVFTETSKIPIISNGKVNQIITILRDITNHKEAEAKLKTSEERYKNIINNLMDIIIMLDLKGNFEYVSPQIYDISGFTPEEIVGKNGFKLMHPEDIKKAADVLKDAMINNSKVYIEYRTIHKDGHYIDVSASGRIINIDGEDKIFAIVKDISDKKRSEYKLKESEERYRLINESVNDLIAIINEKVEYEYINEPAFQNIMGRSTEDLMGNNALRWVHPDDYSKCMSTFMLGWELGKANVQARFKDARGKYRWLDVRGQQIIDQKGEQKILVVSRDISDIKEAEENLKKSEEKYRNLIQDAPVGVWALDENENTILVNPKICEMLNYTEDEILGKNLKNFIPETMKTIIKGKRHIREKGIKETYELQLIKKDGTIIYTEISAAPILDENSVYIGSIAYITDITSKKIAEDKLRESEEKYRHITENAYDLITVFDENFKYEYINEKPYLNLLGYTPDDLIGKYGSDMLHPDEKMHIIKQFQKVVTDGKASVFVRLRHKNGHYIWTDTLGTLFLDKDGNRKVIAITRDVTDRITVEEELKKSEEKHRLILENANDLISILNSDFKYEYVNEKAFNKLLGFTKEDFIDRTPLDYLHPDEAQEVARTYQENFMKGSGSSIFRFQSKDGQYKWLEGMGTTFIDTDGEKKGLIISRDITESREAEQKLRESEEKYRLISENTEDLIVVFKKENATIEYLNAETHSRVLGYDFKKFYEKSFRDSLVHKDDLIVANKSASEGVEKGFYQYQFRLKHKNGHYIWFEVTGKTFLDDQGKEKVLCVSRNINEKKIAEEQIKESEENFRTIAEQAFIGTLIIQEDRVEYVNDALLQIFEFSGEEVDDWKKSYLTRLIYPEDLQFLREYRYKLRTGESDVKPYYSYRVFTKYGKIKWIEQFSRPIVYKGEPAELVSIMDITEKKRAEEELIKLNSLKSELLRRTSHELKTPLVSIKGFSDLLLTVHREKLDDYVLATIHEIKLGCERLENLVQDILKTAELESDSVELKKTEEDLSFLIKLCIRELQGLIRLRNHEIRLHIHDRLVTKFEPDQIHLVLSNLINNAIKYTPPNGIIEINSAITDYDIQITIQDNGIGITNEERKRLFSQFGKIERYGQGLDIISEGSGLGLFITKKIIELHDGKIWVRSKGRNKGTTFYFTLPLIKDDEE